MNKNLLLSLLILFIIAGDFMALGSEVAILNPQPGLQYRETDNTSTLALMQVPIISEVDLTLPKLLFYFFYAGGVFNAVATFNLDYSIYGLPVGAKEGTPWVDLGFVNECFPFNLGETYLRMDLEWHRLLGEKVYQTAMDNLAAKIRNKYNREHPNQPVQKIAIYMSWWPRSEKGYEQLRNPTTNNWVLLTAEK